jgi:hypothetical protein
MCVGRIGINEFVYGTDQSFHACEIDRLRTENEFLRHQVRNMRKECDTAIDRASKKENKEEIDPKIIYRFHPENIAEEEEYFKKRYSDEQQQELRIKALELAVQEIDNMGCNNSVDRERLMFNAANRFYNYITKGE